MLFTRAIICRRQELGRRDRRQPEADVEDLDLRSVGFVSNTVEEPELLQQSGSRSIKDTTMPVVRTPSRNHPSTRAPRGASGSPSSRRPTQMSSNGPSDLPYLSGDSLHVQTTNFGASGLSNVSQDAAEVERRRRGESQPQLIHPFAAGVKFVARDGGASQTGAHAEESKTLAVMMARR